MFKKLTSNNSRWDCTHVQWKLAVGWYQKKKGSRIFSSSTFHNRDKEFNIFKPVIFRRALPKYNFQTILIDRSNLRKIKKRENFRNKRKFINKGYIRFCEWNKKKRRRIKKIIGNKSYDVT